MEQTQEKPKINESLKKKIYSEADQEVGLPVCRLNCNVVIDNLKVKRKRCSNLDFVKIVNHFTFRWEFIRQQLPEQFFLTNWGYLIPREKECLFKAFESSNFSLANLPCTHLIFSLGVPEINPDNKSAEKQFGKLIDLFNFCMAYHNFLEETKKKGHIDSLPDKRNKTIKAHPASLIYCNGLSIEVSVEVKADSFFLWTNALERLF